VDLQWLILCRSKKRKVLRICEKIAPLSARCRIARRFPAPVEVYEMRFYGAVSSRLIVLALMLLLVSVPPAFAQNGRMTSQSRDTAEKSGARPVNLGEKLKLKGTIARRDADTFSVVDDRNLETIVLLTERTSVKSRGGFFRFGKNYDVTSLLRGLPVEVEGIGNRDGQLVADKVRFDSSDLKVARMVDKRVNPVEEATERLSGQVDELGEVSRLAREDAGRAHERISSLDDYSVEDSVTILFRTNSAVISPEDRRALDGLAQKAAATKGYVIEVAGYADSTGNLERNRVLSQQRADAVVRYLQENHDVPLRRMITPYGYGQTRPVADNGTIDGRRQNRRVEVKILVNRGIAAASPK
jgi:outer membrane protein OmpA-like peptidoglycan-associated protein